MVPQSRGLFEQAQGRYDHESTSVGAISWTVLSATWVLPLPVAMVTVARDAPSLKTDTHESTARSWCPRRGLRRPSYVGVAKVPSRVAACGLAFERGGSGRWQGEVCGAFIRRSDRFLDRGAARW
ncbi:hypothetical protein GCM10018781_64520 [Kitasatospora indigofera]|uniref:Uncharacterized protein n=1 Tax=Kitasatospora indigofera TaxID=67307 RepID=A0A919GB67_9ACTN|nr:hypothetical protein GCM10018781_64520 [Kitasatospora indigofera]